MNYVVMDLEWNQSNEEERQESELLFEIIEIGAIRLNDSGVITGEFNELIRPQVHREMHYITSRLVHMEMQELEQGREFPEAAELFLKWCGAEEYLFCTWGSLDLLELQRNMDYYNMTPLSDKPIAYLDVQKLFGIAWENGEKQRRNLEYAIDYLGIEKDIPFHRAFSDAYYTAKIMQLLLREKQDALKKVSFDLYHPPKDRKSEVKIQFDTYMKYISRVFDSRMDAFADKEVISSKCYLCHRNLRKKIKWFSPNGRHYYCVANCEKHGLLKGKIRVHRTDNGKVYVVKTTRFITEEEAELIVRREKHCKEQRKRKRQKSRDYD